jgi:uncharacterized membrane protein YedE/YeeE
MKEPLAWYIAGPLIGLVVPILLILKEKQFGISSNYRYIISKFTKKPAYFNYNNQSDAWQFSFAIGLIIVGIAYHLSGYDLNAIAHADKIDEYIPTTQFYDIQNWLLFLLGGVLIGFGARWSNGCTAGHCIMGMSQLSKTSFIATIAFFIGGLIATYFIIPHLF